MSELSSSKARGLGSDEKDTDTPHDNPCWGSPEKCSLQDLITMISEKKQPIVLFESLDYVAIDKPPDLRMDGPHLATVHKLLLYLYPPPSLREKFSVNSQNHPLPPSKNELLLDFIQQHFHQHGDVADPKQAVRPCHQLDYATSGLLWVARTPHAAHLATTALEQRCVQKTYSALVCGCVSTFENTRLPVLSQERVKEWLQRTEEVYRKTRQKRRKDTFDGFRPPAALFLKYHSSLSLPKKKRKNEDLLSALDWDRVWEPVREALKAVELPASWKRASREVKQAFQEASDIYNEIARSKKEGAATSTSNAARLRELMLSIPTTFRVEGQEQCFYVSIPVGSSEGEFSMCIPPDYSSIASSLKHASLRVGTGEEDYKPCLTRCTLVARTTGDSCVTQVLLEPRTGRRHQLRVHMAFIDNPIVGDETYSLKSRKHNQDGSPARMCLHSHRLSVKLPNETQLDMESPSPFLVNSVSNTVSIRSL